MSLQQYKMKTFINKQDTLANNLTDENSSEYYKRRYLIVKEINQINKVFEIMNSEKINSYNDVDQRILQYEDDYSFLKRNYDNLKIHNRQLQKLMPIAKIYIETCYYNDALKECRFS